MMKATNGQPPHFNQRGTGRPSPWLLASSVSVPSGQNTPHHTRPISSMETITNGHQMPQNMNCANRVRWFSTLEPVPGNGRKAGITTSAR